MKNNSLVTNWEELNEKYQKIWSISILTLLSVSFVVTDWMIGILTLSDYIFIIIGAILSITGNYRVKKEQLPWIVLILVIIIGNIVTNAYFNESFVFKTGIAALLRFSYYITILVGSYNYVKSKRLEEQLLKILNITAVLVCLIGIYITIALYTDEKLPYEFFWTFTRTDLASYIFKNNLDIIRTRSIFSEPSYFGYFLNILLTMNMFNNKNIKINKIYTTIISVTLILTFSYSAIATMVLIFGLYSLDKLNPMKFKWTKTKLLYIVLFSMVIFLSWEFFNETIISRTTNILTGQDTSAYNRIISSWAHINKEHIFIGNGIGHTPSIWNIYAYILSDLGIIAFILSILFSIYVLCINFRMGLIFIALNFQKGGYLNPAFSIFILLMLIYMTSDNKRSLIYKNVT